jgi:hypothetical protein
LHFIHHPPLIACSGMCTLPAPSGRVEVHLSRGRRRSRSRRRSRCRCIECHLMLVPDSGERCLLVRRFDCRMFRIDLCAIPRAWACQVARLLPCRRLSSYEHRT